VTLRSGTRYLRELLEADHHLVNIWVAGEISNYNRAASGHIFFTLKDDRSGLRCTFFRNRNIGLRTPLANGLSVVVYGSVSLYEQRGELSFVVDFVQPEGAGGDDEEAEQKAGEEKADPALNRAHPRPSRPFRRRRGAARRSWRRLGLPAPSRPGRAPPRSSRAQLRRGGFDWRPTAGHRDCAGRSSLRRGP